MTEPSQKQEAVPGERVEENPLGNLISTSPRGATWPAATAGSPRNTRTRGAPGPPWSFLFSLPSSRGEALGLSGVKLTGGEPLLHPQIKEIIGHITKENLRLTMETNGILMTEDMAALLASCPGVFVSVSIDGSRAETHEHIRGVEGSFNKACDAVRHLVRAGISPQVIMSVMRENRAEMEGLVALARSLGAGSVKFKRRPAHGAGREDAGIRGTLTIGELIETGAWVERTLSAATPMRLFYSHPAAFRPWENSLAIPATARRLRHPGNTRRPL